jgi:Ca2+-binding EF-hand superfamily protein
MLERLDPRGQGVVSRTDMMRTMKKMGVRLPPSELTKVIRAFEVRNGQVRYREFCLALKNRNPLKAGLGESTASARGTLASAADSQVAAPSPEPDTAIVYEANALMASDAGVQEALPRLANELKGRQEEVRSMLERLDPRGQGVVSRTDMMRGMKKMGVRLPPSELTMVLRSFDANSDGLLRCGDFYAALYGDVRSVNMSRYVYRASEIDLAVQEALSLIALEMHTRGEDVMSMLVRMDTNHNGIIETKEFTQALKKLDFVLYPSEAELATRAFDLNGDGVVRLDELYSIMMGHQQQKLVAVPHAGEHVDGADQFHVSAADVLREPSAHASPSPSPAEPRHLSPSADSKRSAFRAYLD